MGLTWIFGFLMLFAEHVAYQQAMAWAFTIINSAQVRRNGLKESTFLRA